MHAKIVDWKKDRLWAILMICWLATVFFSYFGSGLFSVSIPLIGALYPFRVLLPITFVLYVLWAVKGNDRFWKDSAGLEKWVYILIGCMLVYSVLSLPRALNFMYTFRKLFNLCFDLCFFFLALRLCCEASVFRWTMYASGIAVTILCIMGVYEVFFGGIFSDIYDNLKRFELFYGIYQFPVVTAGNTNDYSLIICFSSAMLLLAREKKSTEELTGLLKIFPVLLLPVAYFLAIAASSRLVMLSYWILFVVFFVCSIIKNKRSVWLCLVVLVLWGGIHLANQYEYIAPSVRTYIAEMKEYRETAVNPLSTQPEETQANIEQETQPSTEGVAVESTTVPTAKKPKLEIQQDPQKEALKDQFLQINEETGEAELRADGSAGSRAHLLIYAARCFMNSYGLGVGLGNTEVLAARQAVVPWGDAEAYSIHCFIARIIADYGIFVLIPLCAIVLLLFCRIWKLFLAGWKTKDRTIIAKAILLFGCIAIYPIVSTASSDAQDSLAMWLYLAILVIISCYKNTKCESKMREK